MPKNKFAMPQDFGRHGRHLIAGKVMDTTLEVQGLTPQLVSLPVSVG